MMKPLSAAVLASLLLAVACEQAPTDVMEPDGPAAFKKGGGGGGKPGDPPPPIVDPAIVLSSSRDANTGGGPSKRGDLGTSIYRMDLTGAIERVFGDDLETQSWNMNPKWAPDGQRFVFHRDIYEISKGKISSEVFQIATATIDGNDFHVLREISRGSGHLDNARWSPVPVGGAERIVWVEDWSEIVIVGTDGSYPTPTTVATAGEDERFRGFEWFSGGTRLIGQVLDQTTGAYFLRLYDVSCGSSSSTCTATPAMDLTDLAPIGPYDWFGDVAVARSHDWIVATVCPGGRGPCDLWKIDLTAPAAPIVTRLTLTESNEGDLSWSPDPVDDDSKILLTTRPIRSARKAIILDLTLLVSLPWDGDLSDRAVTVIADVGGSGGMDWAMSP